jgi:hypothetical protein
MSIGTKEFFTDGITPFKYSTKKDDYSIVSDGTFVAAKKILEGDDITGKQEWVFAGPSDLEIEVLNSDEARKVSDTAWPDGHQGIRIRVKGYTPNVDYAAVGDKRTYHKSSDCNPFAWSGAHPKEDSAISTDGFAILSYKHTGDTHEWTFVPRGGNKLTIDEMLSAEVLDKFSDDAKMSKGIRVIIDGANYM